MKQHGQHQVQSVTICNRLAAPGVATEGWGNVHAVRAPTSNLSGEKIMRTYKTVEDLIAAAPAAVFLNVDQRGRDDGTGIAYISIASAKSHNGGRLPDGAFKFIVTELPLVSIGVSLNAARIPRKQ